MNVCIKCYGKKDENLKNHVCSECDIEMCIDCTSHSKSVNGKDIVCCPDCV